MSVIMCSSIRGSGFCLTLVWCGDIRNGSQYKTAYFAGRDVVWLPCNEGVSHSIPTSFLVDQESLLSATVPFAHLLLHLTPYATSLKQREVIVQATQCWDYQTVIFHRYISTTHIYHNSNEKSSTSKWTPLLLKWFWETSIPSPYFLFSLKCADWEHWNNNLFLVSVNIDEFFC